MHQSVYVRFDIGSDNSSCGSKTRPCKYIETAVDKSTSEVIIIGTIPLNRTINVRRSLTIRSEGSSGNATVKRESATDLTAFSLPNDIEVKISITGISFVDVGVVLIGSHSSVMIHNCHVTGDLVFSEYGEKVFRFRRERLQRSLLTVVNTTFAGITGSVIHDQHYDGQLQEAVVVFTDCTFYNITYNGVYNNMLIQSLTLTRCHFTDIGLDCQCWPLRVKYTHTLHVTNCTFNNIQRKETWAFIEISDVVFTQIAGSHFSNMFSGERGVDVSSTTTVVLHNNTFSNNIAKGFAIVYVKGCTIVSIDNCVFHNNKGGERSVVYIAPWNTHAKSNDLQHQILQQLSKTTCSCHLQYRALDIRQRHSHKYQCIGITASHRQSRR